MANLVPKTNNVGTLGSSAKLWNNVFQTTSSFGNATITEESGNLKLKTLPVTVEDNLTVAGSLSVSAQSAALSLNSQKITNVGQPTSANDAATKAYVDSVAQGLDVKGSVRVATTAAITLSSDLENGDTIDGVSLSTGDRVLVKDQATASENGIYVVAASGAPARSDDLAASSSAAGVFVFVEEGTTNADAGFVCTTNSGSDTVGTDSLTFSQFSGSADLVAGGGLDKTGSTLSVNVDDSSIEINSDTLRVKAAGITSSMLSSTAVDNTNLDAASITGQTAETAIADDDLVLIYDTSATALRKMTKANFVSGLSSSSNIFSDNVLPDGSNTRSLGSASAEWSDLYLGDGSRIYLGNDQDVYLEHDPDDGIQLHMASETAVEPTFSIVHDNSSSNYQGPSLQLHNTTADLSSDIAGSIKFKNGSLFSGIIFSGGLGGASGTGTHMYFSVYPSGGSSIQTALTITGQNNAAGTIVQVNDHNGSTTGLKLGSTLVTSSGAELNILDGATVTAAELNSLDVSAQSPSDNEVLTYTTANGLHWAATSGGSSSAPTVTSASPSSAYTISTYSGIEEIYLLDPSASITVNLPSAATAGSGYKYQIKNLSTNTITLDPSSTETIDASTTVDINTQYSSLTLVSDGTNWFII